MRKHLVNESLGGGGGLFLHLCITIYSAIGDILFLIIFVHEELVVS